MGLDFLSRLGAFDFRRKSRKFLKNLKYVLDDSGTMVGHLLKLLLLLRLRDSPISTKKPLLRNETAYGTQAQILYAYLPLVSQFVLKNNRERFVPALLPRTR